MHICLSIRYIHIHLSIYTVDVHIQTDKHLYQCICMSVYLSLCLASRNDNKQAEKPANGKERASIKYCQEQFVRTPGHESINQSHLHLQACERVRVDKRIQKERKKKKIQGKSPWASTSQMIFQANHETQRPERSPPLVRNHK